MGGVLITSAGQWLDAEGNVHQGGAAFVYGSDKAATIARAGLSDPGALVVHNGNYIANVTGAVIEDLDITGYVQVTAADVTFRNCRFRLGNIRAGYNSGTASPGGVGTAAVFCESTGTLFEFCEIDPSTIDVNRYGFVGSGYTARDCSVHDVVDAIHVNRNVGSILIEGGHYYDLRWYSADPRQTDGSHNDIAQILRGPAGGITFRAVVMDSGIGPASGRTSGADSANFAILTSPNEAQYPVIDLLIELCWFVGYTFSVLQLAEVNAGTISYLIIRNNRFESDAQNAIIRGGTSSINGATITGNTGPDGNALAAGEISAVNI